MEEPQFLFESSSPDPLTRGSAPGPIGGSAPRTPVIGSRSRARHGRLHPRLAPLNFKLKRYLWNEGCHWSLTYTHFLFNVMLRCWLCLFVGTAGNENEYVMRVIDPSDSINLHLSPAGHSVFTQTTTEVSNHTEHVRTVVSRSHLIGCLYLVMYNDIQNYK